MEGQLDWAGHAAFMDAPHADGVVGLVGLREGTADALLIARAATANEIKTRLSDDP